MKILYVITGLGVGGAEKIVTTTADQMIQAGHSVKIVYLIGAAKILPSSKEIEVIKLDLNSIFKLILCIINLRNIIKNYQPDIVHGHMFHSNLICRLTRCVTSINRLICTVHNSNEGGKLRMIAYRLTNFLSDINTNVSQEATESLIKKGAFKNSQIRTVYNGIDTNYFKFNSKYRERLRSYFNISEDEKILIAIGSLSIQKDYPNLINSLTRLESLNNIKLFIVGDGALEYEIKCLILKNKLQDKVIFLGIRNDIPALLSMSDIFILSSAWEGFGLVVAEAMACERIVVATDCGGVSEVLGDTGILVPIKNSVLLSHALQEAFSIDKEKGKKIGCLARDRVLKNYSLQISTAKWLSLYKEIL